MLQLDESNESDKKTNKQIAKQNKTNGNTSAKYGA